MNHKTETTSTHSGVPDSVNPITDDTDAIAYRVEVRRGGVGFLSEGVE